MGMKDIYIYIYIYKQQTVAIEKKETWFKTTGCYRQTLMTHGYERYLLVLATLVYTVIEVLKIVDFCRKILAGSVFLVVFGGNIE